MKKFISVMLVAAMAVTALTGCGSNSGSSSKKDADKYYIGGIGPTTGATAIYGTAVKNGAQIAVDEINAAGGINGKQIEYRFEDDQNDAEKAVNAYNTLKDWGMQMLVGTTTTAPCIAVAGKTASDNVFQITPSASSPDVLSSGNGNVFQVCFTDPNQGVASAQYIAENKLATKIGIIYDSSDVYSSGIEEKFEAEAKTQGLNIVSKAAFTADSKTDLSSIITPASLAASFTIRSARAFASAMMDSLDFIIWRLSASSLGRRVRTSSSIANSSSRFILIILPLLKTPAVLQLSTYTSISSINSSILIFAILFLPYRS